MSTPVCEGNSGIDTGATTIGYSYHSVTRAMCPILYKTRGHVAPEGREQCWTHCPRNRVITGFLQNLNDRNYEEIEALTFHSLSIEFD